MPVLSGVSTALLRAIASVLVDTCWDVLANTLNLACSVDNSFVLVSTSFSAFSRGENAMHFVPTTSDRRRTVGKASSVV